MNKQLKKYIDREAAKGEKLLPCPFCGSNNVEPYKYEDDGRERFIVCRNCRCEGPFIDRDNYEIPSPGGIVNNISENIDAWNKRAPINKGEK